MDVKAYMQAPIPRWFALAVVVGTGVATTGSTYLMMKRRYESILDNKVQEELAKSEKFLSTISTKPYSSPMEAITELEVEVIGDAEEIIEAQAYATTDQSGDLVEVTHNVFTNMKESDFDFETELPKRSPDHPYIITETEYFESENQTITLTWFDGDEVLSDEKDEHIPDIERVVGEDNLLRFGYGSGDPNLLYIRNEKMEVDFEVVRNEGKYTEQVMGFIQHEDKRGPLKFRTYDD